MRVARRGGERGAVVARDGLGVRGGERVARRLDGARQVAHRRVARAGCTRGPRVGALRRRQASPRPAARRRARARRARGRRAHGRGGAVEWRMSSRIDCRSISARFSGGSASSSGAAIISCSPCSCTKPSTRPPKVALLLGEHLLVGEDVARRPRRRAAAVAAWWCAARRGGRARRPRGWSRGRHRRRRAPAPPLRRPWRRCAWRKGARRTRRPPGGAETHIDWRMSAWAVAPGGGNSGLIGGHSDGCDGGVSGARASAAAPASATARDQPRSRDQE